MCEQHGYPDNLGKLHLDRVVHIRNINEWAMSISFRWAVNRSTNFRNYFRSWIASEPMSVNLCSLYQTVSKWILCICKCRIFWVVRVLSSCRFFFFGRIKDIELICFFLFIFVRTLREQWTQISGSITTNIVMLSDICFDCNENWDVERILMLKNIDFCILNFSQIKLLDYIKDYVRSERIRIHR